MPTEITMPQLSDTMTEGTVVKWLKKEGDKIKSGDIIAEVETDKATMEMESFDSGTLAVLAVKEGGKVAVGDAIAVLATGKETVDDVKKARASAGGSSSKPGDAQNKTDEPELMPFTHKLERPEQTSPPVSGGDRKKAAEHPHAAPGSEGQLSAHSKESSSTPPAGEPSPKPAEAASGQSTGGSSDRVKASPLARRIAADRGIDLSQIQGSGPGGRIVQADVVDAPKTAAKPETATPKAEKSSAPASQAAPQPQRVGSGATETIDLSKMRQTIALRLQQSKQQLPHFYESIDIDVEDLTNLREAINKRLEKQKVRLSISDLVNKAIAAALVEHPAVNAHFNAPKNQITRFGDVHLGIAVALPDGLIVPVLRNINQMGLREIRERSVDLVQRARDQRLKRDEMSGATFTVSTLGMFGIREFSAIINPPEVGILAVGAAEKRAVVRDDQIVARTMMTVTLSVDHRAVDGAMAAEFLGTLKSMLEQPGMMLV